MTCRAEGARVVTVILGEHRISDDPDTVLTTILGSCVAACIFARGRGIGGMNHFLLPGADPRDSHNVKYGAHAMEQLINALLRAGARRDELQAKLFGGANVVRALSNIGQANAEFARRFLADEGIALVSHCLGGARGRRVRFWPVSGRAQVMTMGASFAEARLPAAPAPAGIAAGEVELF